MCIINLPVFDVTKTRLLVAKMNRDWQFVSYANHIKLDPKYPVNQMILAVPCEANEIQVSDSKEDWSTPLMKKIHNAFRNNSFGISKSIMKRTLVVEAAGNYLFSRANSIEDLKLVNENEFSIDPDCWKFLNDHYAYCPVKMSFLILKLSKSGNYHPFNFVFPTKRMGDHQLFVPTLHYHRATSDDSAKSVNKAEFDHEIYALTHNQVILGAQFANNSPMMKMEHYPVSDKAEEWVDEIVQHTPLEVRIFQRSQPFSFSLSTVTAPDLPKTKAFCSKIDLKGELHNTDLIIKLGAEPNNNQAVHEGVFCDSCGADNIKGLRYSCNKCDDVDFCFICRNNDDYLRFYGKGHNPAEHDLIEKRVVEPPTHE